MTKSPIYATILGVLATGVLLGPAGSADAVGGVRAVAAHALRGSETAHLHLVRADGADLLEEGFVSGRISGQMHARLHLGTTYTGSLTTYTRYGSIKGHGGAVPHGTGRYQSFAGSIVITGGTGRYIHAHGRSGFYGVFDRRTYAVIVQTTGTLYY
jgi:hypothetical protein